MLVGSGVKKIMVCAPSNNAIDEVITRISKRGFIGSKINPEGQILRLGISEFDPNNPEIYKHSLDARINRHLSIYEDNIVLA